MKKRKVENLIPLLNAVTRATEGFKDGRMTPILMVNAEGHEDFLLNIKAHQTAEFPGDIIFNWAWPKSRFSKPMAYIKIQFVKPIECSISIAIDPVMYGEVIDAIFLSKILTIIHVRDDLANIKKKSSPSISMEVPESATFPNWEEIYLNALVKRYKKKGIKKKRSIELAKQLISDYRKAWITKDFSSLIKS